NVEEQQPEKPNPKREGDEEQRGQPGFKFGWNDQGRKKKVVDRVDCEANQPRFESVALGPPRVSATEHRDDAEQRKIELALIAFVHRRGSRERTQTIGPSAP